MNLQIFLNYFSHFTTLLMLVNVVIGLYYFKYYENLWKSIVIYLLGVTFLDIFLSALIESEVHFTYQSLISFLKFFTRIFEFLMLSYLIAVMLLKHKKLFGFLVIFSLYFPYELLFLMPDNERNYVSYATIVSYVILLTISVFSLISLIKEDQINMKRAALAATLLFYTSIMVVFFVIENFVVNQHRKPTTIYLYIAYVITVFLFHVALNVQLWRNGRIQKRSLAGLS